MVFDVGRICVKTAGRDAGGYCVIVKKLDKDYVLVTGPKIATGVRRRKCNLVHLEPLPEKIKLIPEATDKAVLDAYKKEKVYEKLKIKPVTADDLKKAEAMKKEKEAKRAELEKKRAEEEKRAEEARKKEEEKKAKEAERTEKEKTAKLKKEEDKTKAKGTERAEKDKTAKAAKKTEAPKEGGPAELTEKEKKELEEFKKSEEAAKAEPKKPAKTGLKDGLKGMLQKGTKDEAAKKTNLAKKKAGKK